MDVFVFVRDVVVKPLKNQRLRLKGRQENLIFKPRMRHHHPVQRLCQVIKTRIVRRPVFQQFVDHLMILQQRIGGADFHTACPGISSTLPALRCFR